MTAENFVPGPYFGDFGGRFVAESLMDPLRTVEAGVGSACGATNPSSIACATCSPTTPVVPPC